MVSGNDKKNQASPTPMSPEQLGKAAQSAVKSFERLIAVSERTESLREVVAEQRIRAAHESHLESLDLNHLALQRIPESLGSLTELKRLDLSGNLLTEIPTFLAKLKKLFWLDLSRNRLASLPDCFADFGQLERLDVSENGLKMMPEWVGQLARIREINISTNELTALPTSFRQLAELRELKMAGNKLTALPESLGELTFLCRLNVANNDLCELPQWLGQLDQLLTLDSWGNRLSTLPDSIGELARLLELNLRDNELRTLPTSIGQLRRLRSLNVSDNRLTALPESIGDLIQLQNLDVSHNLLLELPGSLRQLTELWCFNASDNQLAALPAALGELTSLKELYLHANEKLGLPAEVLGTWRYYSRTSGNKPAVPAEVLEYYYRQRAANRSLNEAKLILVGRGGAGKTSLVNRLVHGMFNPKEQKTDGIGITFWPLAIGQEKVRLNVWDFGGQEIMHATHQFFLTRRSLYLLVLNAREGEQDANVEYWLKMIESFGAESPAIVVINKIQAHTFDLNRRGLLEKYPAIRDFIQTDCESGTGLDELRQAIQRETDRLENLRDPFPAAWFKVKDELARMQQSYMSFEQYREFCKARGVEEAQSQESLVSVLHRLGIVLNFRDDARLCDLNVLKPEWVTKGIYRLLNADALAKTGGVLEASDLGRLLDGKEYPLETHSYLIDLMKKFDLCFEFEESKGARYLIPELLGKEEPVLANWHSEDALQFQYHYNILPEGLLPRFIVLTHAMSEGRARWRTGVVLAFDGNEALVKADVQDRRVFISVRGGAEGRRRLLAVIRAQLEHIHRSIPKLEAVEKVQVPGNAKAPAMEYRHLLKLEIAGEETYWPPGADQALGVRDVLDGYTTPEKRLAEWTTEHGGRMGDVIHVHGSATINTGDKSMENIGRDKNTQNISGSTFNNSPIAIRQILQNSYNTIQQASDKGLKKKLEELLGHVAQLMARLDDKQQAEAKDNLEALVKESTKPEPRRKWYDLSAEGLIDAAKSVNELAAPITATLKELGSLLFSGS